MNTETEPYQKRLEESLMTAEADAFAQVCKYGDKMLGYGILMCVSAVALGFGIQLDWWPLIALGTVLVLLFGAIFLDARRSSNLACARSDALTTTVTELGSYSAAGPAAGGREVFVTVPSSADE